MRRCEPGTSQLSASFLNVASVRPAIGRTKRRSTTRGNRSVAQQRQVTREFVLDRHVAAVAGRADMPGDVHPLGSAADVCWKRRRRSSGSASSAHCSLRHQTGIPKPAPQRPDRGHGRRDSSIRYVTEWSPVDSAAAAAATARCRGRDRRRRAAGGPRRSRSRCALSLAVGIEKFQRGVDQLGPRQRVDLVARRTMPRHRLICRLRRAGRRR